jgi:hypothetical protein
LQELKLDDMLEFTGFDVTEVDQMLKNIDGLVIDDPQKEWGGMPEFNQENKMGVKEIIVHFETWDDRDAFAEVIDPSITKQTKYIWYPKKEIHKTAGIEYANIS